MTTINFDIGEFTPSQEEINLIKNLDKIADEYEKAYKKNNMLNITYYIDEATNTLEKLQKILHKDINFLKSLGTFDVLTVNPPYKLNNSGILNPDDKLAIARHEILCNLEDVIRASRRLLKDNGRMYMVHRPERLIDIFELMRKYKIEPKRVQMIHPKMNKAPNIVLVEGQRDGGAYLKWEAPLYVYNEDDDIWTPYQ